MSDSGGFAIVYTVEAWGTWGTDKAHWRTVRALPQGSVETDLHDALAEFRAGFRSITYQGVQTEITTDRTVLDFL